VVDEHPITTVLCKNTIVGLLLQGNIIFSGRLDRKGGTIHLSIIILAEIYIYIYVLYTIYYILYIGIIGTCR
jgi:hypothetical protein